MDKQEFIKELVRCFPYLKDDILDTDYEGLFSLQVGVFRDYTQEAIDSSDKSRTNSHFDFILQHYDKFDDDVENSIVLSYIGKLNFGRYPKPKLFEEVQRMLNEYFQDLLVEK